MNVRLDSGLGAVIAACSCSLCGVVFALIGRSLGAGANQFWISTPFPPRFPCPTEVPINCLGRPLRSCGARGRFFIALANGRLMPVTETFHLMFQGLQRLRLAAFQHMVNNQANYKPNTHNPGRIGHWFVRVVINRPAQR